jgi:uncharacterized repeat protein (TIGR02543 family)
VTVTASDDEDYTFVSFQRDGKDVSTGKTYAFTMPSAAVSITGIYKPVTYTVALDVNGGDALKTSTYQVIYKNGITLPAPTRTGYSFSGWYDGSAQVSGSTFWLNVRQSVTLTAHWTANKYTLTLDGNGGKIGTSTSASVAVTYGEAYSVPTATRYGYVFGGWFNGKRENHRWDLVHRGEHYRQGPLDGGAVHGNPRRKRRRRPLHYCSLCDVWKGNNPSHSHQDGILVLGVVR